MAGAQTLETRLRHHNLKSFMDFHQHYKIMKAYRFLLLLILSVVAASCSDEEGLGSLYQPADAIDVKAYCTNVKTDILPFAMPEMIRFQLILTHDEEASATRESENERLEKEILDYALSHKPTYKFIPHYVSVYDDSVEEIKITANKTLFGIEAGEELNSHFSATAIEVNSVVTYSNSRKSIKYLQQLSPNLYSPINSVLGPKYMLLTGIRFAAHKIPEYYDYDDVTITVYLRLTSGAEFTSEMNIPFYN